MNQPPLFNAQFFEDDGTPLVGGLLYTYTSGTVTPLTTYQDQAGAVPNTNPVVLDAAGRCDLWLSGTAEYTLLLKRADETTVKSWDDVAGTATAGSAVTSVNTQTGAVVLTADDIAFTTATATTWFVGTDVTAALDSIIDRTDAMPASGVSVLDAGGLLTATNVEAALAELATSIASVSGGAYGLPTQTGNSGKFLTTNGTDESWATVALSAFTAAIASGDLTVSVPTGVQTYGARTCTATGGTAPYTYFWVLTDYGTATVYGRVYPTGNPTSATAAFAGNFDDKVVTSVATCFVTDATGRVTTAAVGINATHAAAP